MADDQREALCAIGRNDNGKLGARNVMDFIRFQHREVMFRGMRPTGISLSMDVAMDAAVCAQLVPIGSKEQKLLGLPLTIIGDANGVIAWSFNL
ncbi:hypothetical protein CPT_Silvanus_040 [Stenotrophomonas phage Silvanus]|nr:hypothetical protein CPT_Silvanus_040 [Stenotrophomonas phage Silvanus]